MSRQKDFDDRPPSEQLVDLVVYVVPAELWKERLHSAFSDVINETVSAGFLRVHPETPVAHLREEIQIQLEDEYDLPQEYVFVKNVGRRLTKVRKKQEMQLKVKNFIDPQSYACEIFLLEGGSDTQSIHPSSVSSSYRGEPTTQEDPYHLDSYRSKGTFASQKPVPPIKPGQNGDPGYEDDAPTPPPLSATPTQGLSPYPTTARPGSDGGGDKRGRQKEYLPPLSCTPPPTSPGSQVRPRMKTSADKDAQNRTKHESGSSDGKENNLPHHANDRWEDRNGYLNRSNSYLKREELARQKQEEEARRRQQQEEEMRRRQQEEEARKRQGEEEEMRRRKQEEEARRRREEQQRLRDEENRRKQREQNDRNERQRMEEEARRRREEEEEAERRRRQEEEEQRRREEEEKDRLNAEAQRNDQSDHETQKQTLLEELERLKQERASTEKEREELVRKAKQLQSRTQNRRNQARDIWKKKYFEEKKKTPPLEEQCGKLRQDLDAIHKRIVNSLEGNKEREGRRGAPLEKPSPESNVKIQATRLQHEIEDLQRRVETIKMKLTAEMKLRNQAENELRALRAELTQKKINVTLSRRGQREDNPDLYTPRSQQPISSRT